jgi:nitrogen regulatory protein P-II 1
VVAPLASPLLKWCALAAKNFGARLCAQHQPQHVGWPVAFWICCGWYFRHIRAPLVAA